jgi:flagellar basal body-associated protein FliL
MVDNKLEREKYGLKKKLLSEKEKHKDAHVQRASESEKKNPVKETLDKTGENNRMSTGEYLLISLSVLLILIVMGGGMTILAGYGKLDRKQDVALELSKVSQYPLKPFFVPLRSVAGSEKFLRLNISLDLTNTYSKRLVKHNQKVRGAILQIVLTAIPKDLEYSHGKKALMDKMVVAINKSLGENVVSGLRFTDVVIL